MFRRKSKRGRVDMGRVWEDVNAARMQTMQEGVVPSDMAAGRFPEAPASEYIAEATTPTEEMWAREQAAYRAKNGPPEGTA